MLSKYFGVTAPIIVDKAESVTNLQTADTQIIRLVASEGDKQLRVVVESDDQEPMDGQTNLFA